MILCVALYHVGGHQLAGGPAAVKWRFLPRAAAMPRFSLRSFFLFLFFACMVGSNIFTAFENGRLRQTIEKLQAEFGLLVVSDPNKLHAIADETHEEWTWRWHLHVPKRRRFEYGIATKEIPSSGVVGQGVDVLPEGDFAVTAAIRRDHLDRWMFRSIGRLRVSSDCKSIGNPFR
jgi:hypothetical protein